MRTIHDKLVRDRIPEIIMAAGRACAVDVLDDHAYRMALRVKVVEEARELSKAAENDLAAEAADLYEVVTALLAAHGLNEVQVQEVRRQRLAERGGFANRLRLLWTE